ncbi:kinase-like domain-containing protein [Mycena maculata]|uniref:non-specific serine/threonine protein kinase n=1 Tax=Mycena maculata TaxID=230809 RepID=A0AAD7HHA0_9AGAR|nr:kinase-like domain-containing protein [Mycena maculata]
MPHNLTTIHQLPHSNSESHMQADEAQIDDHLWGYLIPRSRHPQVRRIDLWRLNPNCTMGRDPDSNSLIFPGRHISGKHATMTWNRMSGDQCRISIRDLSAGGTWVSGVLVGHGQTSQLNDGDELALGAPVEVTEAGGLYDFRYTFRNVAGRGPFRMNDYYTRDKLLGQGTFGIVYRAIQKHPKKFVAIKTLTYPVGDTADAVKALAQTFEEIKALESIQHPHVIQIFAAHHATTTPNIHLVIEYMAGGNLFDYLYRENERQRAAGVTQLALPENLCREIMYQLCHAMAYCHALGITHRDLKPENILLRDTESEGPPFIKVADFGLAKIDKNIEKPVLMTSACGSIAYAAPEVLDPRSTGYDNYADSFSAGLIMFMLLIVSDPWCEVRTVSGPLPKMRWDNLTVEMLAPQGHDLLAHLVEPYPSKRLSLVGALGHPWMKAHQSMHPEVSYPSYAT